jgi:WXXGXW repeat (2 copies)/Chaperonin 10 Kd subunit
MNIRPLHDCLIVKRETEERESPSGIVLPYTATKKQRRVIMSKSVGKSTGIRTARNVCFVSLAAANMLAGCVATVRAPGPPPAPPVYVPPPPSMPPPPPSDSTPAVQVEVQATEPPPPLPEYVQPPCPEDGWLWTPGYWAYSSGGYYWVPGTWVAPPSVGLLWTPGYWGFVGGVYVFHAGYWGPHVGFYGGVNYGFGYVGTGFVGGMWVGGHFSYNTAVVNVNTTVVHNTYVNTTVINNVTVNHVSYNGPGGVQREPTPAEKAAMADKHVPPTLAQTQHLREALRTPQLSAKANGGHPPIAATARPATFSGPGVVGAKGAPPLRALAPPAHSPPEGATHAETARRALPHPQAPPRAPVNAAHIAPGPAARAAPPQKPGDKAVPSKPARMAPEKKPEKKPEKNERP